jgi:hypothetical protein
VQKVRKKLFQKISWVCYFMLVIPAIQEVEIEEDPSLRLAQAKLMRAYLSLSLSLSFEN